MNNYMILGKYPVIEAIKSNHKKLLKVYVLDQNSKYLQQLGYNNFKVVDRKFLKKLLKSRILYTRVLLRAC